MKKLTFFLILFLSSHTLFAQKKEVFHYSEATLQHVLLEIGKRFSVHFSFAKENIDGKKVSLKKDKYTLNQLIEKISSENNLNFEKTSASQIIIIPRNFDYSNETIHSLDEVIIKSYITTGIDKNKDGSSTINTQRLGILPGLIKPDIIESIQLIPGVTSINESATDIQIRGSTSDQNLVLLDGIKLYNTGYFYGMFSVFNPYATQKAKVYKSAPSPNFGDRISGVIDISTGDEIPTKTTGGFGIDGLSIDGYIKTPISKKTGFYLYTRRSYSDAIKSFTYNAYATKIFKNSGNVTDINGKTINVISDDDFDINTSNNAFFFYDLQAKLVSHLSEKEQIEFSTL